MARKPNPPALSAEEQLAIDQRARGEPGYDRAAAARADGKLYTAKKLMGEQRRRKARGGKVHRSGELEVDIGVQDDGRWFRAGTVIYLEDPFADSEPPPAEDFGR